MKFEFVSHACLSADYGEIGVMGKMFLVNRALNNKNKPNQ
jgi:hypothetical protein